MTVASLILAALVIGWFAGMAFGNIITTALDNLRRRRARTAWQKAWATP